MNKKEYFILIENGEPVDVSRCLKYIIYVRVQRIDMFNTPIFYRIRGNDTNRSIHSWIQSRFLTDAEAERYIDTQSRTMLDMNNSFLKLYIK